MTSAGAAQPGLSARAKAVVELGLRACQAYQRDDLERRLTAAGRALADPTIHLVVLGEFKQGKSSLVNALVGGTVCPIDDDVATALPTYVRHGESPAAELIYDGDPPRREPIALADVRRWAVEHRGPGTPTPAESGVVGVEVRIPRQLLEGGLVLVDTPGVGGLGSANAAASLTASSMADALLFVTDASQELTGSELAFLRQAQSMCDTVLCVLSKTDFYPAWRTIRELNTGHLGPEIPIIATSAPLRERAVATHDAALNTESGYAELVRFVRDRVAGGAAHRLAVEAAAAVVNVCEQIESQFSAERAALADPKEARRVVADLNQVKDRVEALRSAAARWNQTLGDGIADLSSDVEHDLRSRIREVTREADESIEALDPADTWPEMESWLEARMAHEMLANYTLLRDRATALSEEVGQHFQDASGSVLTRFAVPDPAPLATSVQTDHQIDLAKMKVGKQAMVALKSAYAGSLMFVMLGVMAGITLGPLALGIGVIMGRKGLRDEKKKQRKARQAQARNAIRRYCDQVTFVMGKDSRDTLRRIHRELRDHYTGLAEELNRSNAESLRMATEAANQTQAEREQRLKDLDAELARLRELRQRAEQLAVVQE